jgi:hypothetical protein
VRTSLGDTETQSVTPQASFKAGRIRLWEF